MAEVRRHNTSFSCWIAVEGGVFDITAFMAGGRHPGGQLTLMRMAGLDATDAFLAYHAPRARAQLQAYRIGALDARDFAASMRVFRVIAEVFGFEALRETCVAYGVEAEVA